MVRHHVAELLEPEIRELREHAPLVGDRVGQHHVEGRQPVGDQDHHFVVADGVDVAHLALAKALEAFQG
jgi:hypothetical protein